MTTDAGLLLYRRPEFLFQIHTYTASIVVFDSCFILFT